jgi:hypothetical protein
VLLRYGPGELDIDVRDDGRGTKSPGGDGPGHGLIGMRERVAALRRPARNRPACKRRLPSPCPPSAGVSTRVFIADDQALVRAGFRRLLETTPGIDVVKLEYFALPAGEVVEHGRRGRRLR